ncbi:alcohol dehydrogenase catalytic domain-containing protein [Marinitenerispora sediminis]|uniref:alcohol dehydrogenase catalytic domain-containing protein n=1 Tax=Marinitenerispora sediminis TaxID=1931232 RepID=UPI0013144CEB|nr:alcohol dehydrogenase catalytic domain-containing protein [Marinitenerispora sediminis]
MKGVVYTGPGRVEVDTALPEPRVRGPRDAVVRVTRAAICGTDLHPYRGEIPGFAPGTVLGHEFAGTVVAAGREVPFAPGERVFASDIVACGRCARCARGWHYHCPEATLFGYSTVVGAAVAGGQAEYVRVPYADVVLARTPDGVTDEQALFAGDVLTTAYAAVADAQIRPGDTVGVVGAGPVGLLAGSCAAVAGASTVVVADPDAGRRERARAAGLTAAAPEDFAGVLAVAAEASGGMAIIEAVGSESALRRALDSAGPRATVVTVGAHASDALPFPAARAFAGELTLRFTVGDPIRHRERVLALMTGGRIDPSLVVSHRLPITEAAHGYRLFDQREAFKVVLVTDGTAD